MLASLSDWCYIMSIYNFCNVNLSVFFCRGPSVALWWKSWECPWSASVGSNISHRPQLLWKQKKLSTCTHLTTEGCQVKKPWHEAGRPITQAQTVVFFFFFPNNLARMFPVEICNLCKIKWVTSCRCVYELETLWSKQFQWSDLIYKHRGSTKLHGVTLFIIGSSLPLSECYMQMLWLVSNAVQGETAGSFWSSAVVRRWNAGAQKGNQ